MGNTFGRRQGQKLADWTAAVVVIVGLRWADSYSHSPASEIRYVIVAIVAVLKALGGTAVSLFAKRHRS